MTGFPKSNSTWSPRADKERMRNPQYAGATDTVSLIVGKEHDKQTFVVHKSFLTYHSGYFRAAFSGNSKEATTGVMRIDNVRPYYIEELVGWLYSQNFNRLVYHSPTEMIRLWILGGRYQMPALQDDIMKILWMALMEQDFQPSQALFESIYKSTGENNPLKRLIAHRLAWGPSDLLKKYIDYDTKEFCIAVVMELKHNSRPLGGGRDWKEYLVHEIMTESE